MLLDTEIIPLLPKRFKPRPPSPDTPAFIIADAGSKGVGMFAIRDIPAGTLLLVEQPIVVAPAIVPVSCKMAAYNAFLPRISPAACDTLFALSNCKPSAECGPVEGIVSTNASQIDLPTPDGAEYGGVFPTVSRANHSCSMSTTATWDPASFSVALYTQRIFRAGEEIHHPYVDVLAPRAERRAQLLRRYGFTCTCAHCALPNAAAIARSDAARAELRAWPHLHTSFRDWASDLQQSDNTLIVSHLRALALIAQEGLPALQMPFIEEIALGYALLGDALRFRYWAQRVVDVCGALDAERGKEFATWLENPRTFRLWGWRAKQRKRSAGKLFTPFLGFNVGTNP
ncbi:hypothetical protein C8R43DRAFT_905374 [Mycena crocata]|nr:hypothetical protein C8R43DRAFT_905374 [Mycena crocata]